MPKRWILLGLMALPVLALGAALLLGALAPEAHVVQSAVTLQAPVDTVWAALVDPARAASWRVDLQTVELREHPDGGPPLWVEISPAGDELAFRIVERESPRRLILEIAGDDLPFRSCWTYALEAVDGGTRVSLGEAGAIDNILFRFAARYVFGYHSTPDAVLSSLATGLDNPVTPIHVEPPQDDLCRPSR